MLKVLGHRILIKPDAVKESKNVDLPEGLKKVNFEVHLPGELEKREEAGTQVGTVIDVGPTAWKAFDGADPSWQPWCKVGDRVIFARYAGKFVEDPVTKEKFMVVNDDDIQVKLEDYRAVQTISEVLNG